MLSKSGLLFLFFLFLLVGGIFIYLRFFVGENFEIRFDLLQERKLGDETGNSLYRIFDGEKYFFLATNKVLPAPRARVKKNVEYLGSDIFWSPERCAQMKSFYTKDKIYFFDTTVANPEENNGDEFMNLLHVFDVSTNKLLTYKASKYLNLAEIDKTNLKIFFRDKENKIFQGGFNPVTLSIFVKCQEGLCYKSGDTPWQEKDLYKLSYQREKNIYDKRPYVFQLRDRKTNEIILNTEESENIYHFLVGY